MRSKREEERARFDRLVQEAWLAIPAGFRKRVENVAIVAEDEPGPDDLRRARCPRGSTLLGLYHGIPLTRRTASYGLVLPDKISIYRGPIERIARNERDLARIVRETLWHELGHYFGMDERQVRQAARRWRRTEGSRQ
jgi:predicted Zn-dependent protease with MMP-like domain